MATQTVYTAIMKRMVDLDAWPRREHFQFFRQFSDPFYGVTARFDCTAAYAAAKCRKSSFFLTYLYAALAATQDTPEFHYRIEDEQPVIYDVIDAGAAIDRPDGTFGFACFPWAPQLDTFLREGALELARVRSTSDLERTAALNVIRCSALPWIDFTALSHATHRDFADTCPRISFGKVTERDGIRTFPVAVHVHHAFVDGLHVGHFLDRFQHHLNHPG
jgi:chloramphenicol O-acetyltransferase type A